MHNFEENDVFSKSIIILLLYLDSAKLSTLLHLLLYIVVAGHLTVPENMRRQFEQNERD